MKQRQWFNLHHWAGFQLSILLVFVMFTGTLATISKELDWLTNSAIRANSLLLDEQNLPWADLVVSATRAFPDATLLSIERPDPAWHNVKAMALNTQGERFYIYLDAKTAEVQGTGARFNWQRFFRQVHRHLMLPVKVGVSIVGVCAFALLTLLVSGLYSYKNWWKRFFTLPKYQPFYTAERSNSPRVVAAKKRKFWSDLHKFSGLWSLWFVLLIAVTGTWYVVEQWGGGIKYPRLYNFKVHTLESNTQVILNKYSPVAVNKAIETVLSRYPDYLIEELTWSKTPPYLLGIEGQNKAWLVRGRANKQEFDAVNGDFIAGRQAQQLNWHFRVSEAADPLHMGRLWGWKSRYIWFVFGSILTGLGISGVYMYGLRLKQVTKLPKNQSHNTMKVLWHHYLWLKWPSMLLILVCFGLVILELSIH